MFSVASFCRSVFLGGAGGSPCDRSNVQTCSLVDPPQRLVGKRAVGLRLNRFLVLDMYLLMQVL